MGGVLIQMHHVTVGVEKKNAVVCECELRSGWSLIRNALYVGGS